MPRVPFPRVLRSRPASALCRQALGWLMLGAAAGCHPPYRHPESSEPHAVLRYRRMHEGIPGATETEDLLINGEIAFYHFSEARPENLVFEKTLLLYPGNLELDAALVFGHDEIPVGLETYNSGGPGGIPRRRPVGDAACHTKLYLKAQAGETYQLSLEYSSATGCRVSCTLVPSSSRPEGAPCPTFEPGAK